jgi:hypothetical protein
MKGMKNIEKKIAVALGSGMTSLFLWTTVFAQNTNGGGATVTLCDPLGSNCAQGTETFTSVANNVANFLLVDIAIPLSVIMVLVGAFQIMTAAGDTEKFATGRKTVTYAAIGLALAIIAGGVTSLLKSFLGQ